MKIPQRSPFAPGYPRELEASSYLPILPLGTLRKILTQLDSTYLYVECIVQGDVSVARGGRPTTLARIYVYLLTLPSSRFVSDPLFMGVYVYAQVSGVYKAMRQFNLYTLKIRNDSDRWKCSAACLVGTLENIFGYLFIKLKIFFHLFKQSVVTFDMIIIYY